MFCGCIADIICPKFSIQDSIIQLHHVIELLTELDNKYERDIEEKRSEIKELCKNKQGNKNKKIYLIKTIKLIEFHRHSIQKRMIACQSKQYHLESLNIARIQLNALNATSKTFKKFMKENDINKIEQLQENFSEMIEGAIEIDDIIMENTSNISFDDIDIESELKRITHDDYHLLPNVPVHVPVLKEIQLTERVNSSSALLNADGD